jgi:hypothetical protein
MEKLESTNDDIELYDADVNHNLVGFNIDDCPDPECMECGQIVCPQKEPLHFHHDGCPVCSRLPATPTDE